MKPKGVSLLVGGLLLAGCTNGDKSKDVRADATSIEPSTSLIEPSNRSSEAPRPSDPCAEFPPPFGATYLPPGFSPSLRRDAGLFKGTDYPTEGLLGHYRGAREVVHINFQVRGGPLPYVPVNKKPLTVMNRPARIGRVEGGFSVNFSNNKCRFRMDTYGVTRRETEAVARGLRPIPDDHDK